MGRSQVLDAMGQLRLYEMKAASDEIIATAVKRQHEPQKIVGDLLNTEIREKQAPWIKYQMTIAKLPLATEIDEFDFEDTPVNETLVRDLARGEFLEHQRNVVLIGGTGTGKGISPSASRASASGTANEAGSSTWSISSTSSMPKPAPIARATPPTCSAASTSWSSTSSVTCRKSHVSRNHLHHTRLHRQLTDLGVKIVNLDLMVAPRLIGAVREHLAQAVHRLALARADLIGMNLVARRDLLDRPVVPQRFKRPLRLELRREPPVASSCRIPL